MKISAKMSEDNETEVTLFSDLYELVSQNTRHTSSRQRARLVTLDAKHVEHYRHRVFELVN